MDTRTPTQIMDAMKENYNGGFDIEALKRELEEKYRREEATRMSGKNIRRLHREAVKKSGAKTFSQDLREALKRKRLNSQ